MSLKTHRWATAKVISLSAAKVLRLAAPERIVIPSNGRIDVIHTVNILYFKSESNYTHIYLEDGSHLIACITLKIFDEHLKGGDFIRIHNQYLVHGKYISSFMNGRNKLVLNKQHQIPVSRSRKTVLLDYLKSYMIQTS